MNNNAACVALDAGGVQTRLGLLLDKCSHKAILCTQWNDLATWMEDLMSFSPFV